MLMKETLQFAQSKQELVTEFQEIRIRIREMLDWNEVCPENERLSIAAFNLDKDYIERREKETNEECERLETYLKNLIVAQNKIAEDIKGRYWEQMQVKAQTITALYGTTEVANFALIEVPSDRKQRDETLRQWRELELMLSKNDLFLPSENVPEE